MKETINHIQTVIGFLNTNAHYAVLRNFEELPDSNKARDIDIIITKKSLKKVLKPLAALIDKSGWKIITYLNSDRLYTLVCGRNFEDRTEIVQWDFFVNTSAFGVELLSAEEFLCGRKFNGFLYHVDIDVQFLDKYLYNRFVGSQYPQKYQSTRELAEDMPFVKEKVRELFGYDNLSSCDKAGRVIMFRALLVIFARKPLTFLVNILAFLYTYVRNYIVSTGFSIGFTGPDGAGKTTIIERMIERLGAVFKGAYAYYHFRPTLYGNLGEVAHTAGVKKEVDRNYSNPHRGGETGPLNSLLRLVYYSTDYILGYMVKVKSVVRLTRLVVFDRYYTDIICDSRRTRVYLPYKFVYWFGKVFIPSLDYNILLTAPSDVILERKRELDEECIRSINNKIDYLNNKPSYYRVWNTGLPDEAVTTILDLVFRNQHIKNLKRL